MIPGADQVIFCPRCDAPALVATLVSGNTFGTVVWTDGYRYAPMLPEPPALARCHGCGKVFWLKQAREGGSLPGDEKEMSAKQKVWSQAPGVTPANAVQIYAALKEGLAASEVEEFEARTYAWWRQNDKFRKGEAKRTDVLDSLTAYNLEWLLAFHRRHSARDQLACSELLRELGRCEEAQAELQGLELEAGTPLASVKAQMSWLCWRGDTSVRALDFEFRPRSEE